MASLAASFSISHGTMTVWAVDQFDVVVIVTVAVSSDDQLPGFTVEDDNGVIMSPVENRCTLDSNSLITHTHTHSYLLDKV